MKDVLRIGLIGYGGMGSYHASLLVRDTRYFISGIYDISQTACDNATKNGLRVFATADELLENSDAVLIATPNDNHKEYAILAAERKKHIICEKPAALNSLELNQMFEAAKQNNVVLYIHQNRRWDNDYLTAKNIIQSGVIGDVYRIESRVMGSHGIPGEWRKQKERGGGMLFDWGVHLIDQILLLTKAKVIGIFCQFSYLQGCEVDDGFTLLLDFDDGLGACITVDTNTFIPLPRWEIYGVDGTALIQDWSAQSRAVSVLERQDPHLRAIKAGNGFTKTMAHRSSATVVESNPPTIRSTGREFYDAFYRSACQGKKPIISQKQVIRVMRLMEAAQKSASQRKYIKAKI